jgi:O-antigen ligase
MAPTHSSRLHVDGALDLGRAAVPFLAGLLCCQSVFGRWLPWPATALTGLALTALIGVFVWRVGAGRAHAPPPCPARSAAWFLLWVMAAATVWGLVPARGDGPWLRIGALAAAFALAHDAVRYRDREGAGLTRVVALVGTSVAVLALAAPGLWPTQDGRLAGPLNSPSLLGALVCLTLAPTVWLAMHDPRRWMRALCWVAAATQVAALLGTRSRLAAGAVGLMAVAAWLLPRIRRGGPRPMALVAWLGAAVAVAVTVTALVWLPLRGHESSAVHRGFIWWTSVRILEQPSGLGPLPVGAVGTGVGGYSDAFRAFRPWIGTDESYALAVVRDAHNDILQTLCETGLLGGAAFVFVLLSVIAGWRLRTQAPAAASWRLALAAWTLNGLGNGSVDVAGVGAVAFALIGATVGAGSPQPPREVPRAPTQRWRRAVACCAALLAASAWLAQGGACRTAELLVARSVDLAASDRVRALEAALRLDPHSRDARLALAAARESPEAALTVLRQPAFGMPDPEFVARSARLLRDTDPDQALSAARLAVWLDPYNPYYRRDLAAILADLGSVQEARSELGTALALFERTLEVAEARNGRLSAAAEALRTEIARAREVVP